MGKITTLTQNKIMTRKEADILSDYADIYAELNEVGDEEFSRYARDAGYSVDED